MALRAFLFKDDQKLEAALVDDRSHIIEGATGDHVAKIQAVVMMLDDATIEQAELARKFYGPSTSKAVLNYKTRRQIINPSYQKTADAIVGKMTMKALDDELSRVQGAPQPPAGAAVCIDNSTRQSLVAKLRLEKDRTSRLRGTAIG